MKVIHLSDVPEEENTSSLFTSPAILQNAVTDKEADYNVSWVHFPDGVRNKFHTHSSDQVLIVTEGKGIVATEREEVKVVEGDVILIKKGEKHRHGAITGSKMTHITITAANTRLEQLEK
jgi:quercetin dioxygenase-like cupin family protein